MTGDKFQTAGSEGWEGGGEKISATDVLATWVSWPEGAAREAEDVPSDKAT